MTTRTDPASAVTGLALLAARRMQRWASTTPVHLLTANPAFHEPDRALVAHLDRHRLALSTALRHGTGADAMARRTRSWLRGHNQFVDVQEPALRDLYRTGARATADLLTDSQTTDELTIGLRLVLQDHAARLRTVVRQTLGETPRTVTASTYTPALQLQALGHPPLAGPLLDIGSGTGDLVATLRADGIDAVGLDRDPHHVDAIHADWLHADYGSARWATVLAHLSFALHFHHHELARSPQIHDYARAYLRILASLQPGGTFAYVPSLPFIEHALDPQRYTVTHHAVPFADAHAAHVQRNDAR